MSNGPKTERDAAEFHHGNHREMPELERAIELAVKQPVPQMTVLPIGSAGAQLPPPKRAIDILLNPRAWDMADTLSRSSLVPKQYQGKPGDTLVAVAWGHSLGLDVMQSLVGIAVINGRPCMWGDALLALCRAHGADVEEIESKDRASWTCTVTRPGKKPVVRSFSVDDAQRAGLWNKPGPWTNYPQRMLQNRARGFALRDACADILLGLIDSYEAEDYPTTEPEPAHNRNARGRIAEAIGDRPVLDRVASGPAKAEAPKRLTVPEHIRILSLKAKAMGWTENGGREKAALLLESLGLASLRDVPEDEADRVAEALNLGPDDWSYLHASPPEPNEADWLTTAADVGWTPAAALRLIRGWTGTPEAMGAAIDAGPAAGEGSR